MYEVIEHLPNPQVLFAEISRILKPGGVLIVETGNYHSWTRNIRGSKWDFFSLAGRGGHCCFYSPSVLKTVRNEYNLKLLKTISYSVKFTEKRESGLLTYRMLKLLGEILNIPARMLDKGHQMECFFVKQL